MDLSRDQILGYRRRVSALERRLAHTQPSLRRVAFAGLQDSMPRAASLAINARISDTTPDTWNEPPLVQVWGPRYSAYVVAERDVAVFTLGRLPAAPRGRDRAERVADRLEAALAGSRLDCREAARIVGLHPNALRYAAPTGRFLIYWDGARQPDIWSIPPPEVDPVEARLELARRFLHVFAPATADSFGSWAGVTATAAAETFASLGKELIGVRTPIGPACILASDEPGFRSRGQTSATRLLPSGDTYYLLQGEDRSLLVPDESQRRQLWTSRVWPGAVLHRGELVGTWRRARHEVTIYPWTEMSPRAREEVEAEASTLPIPGLTSPIRATWR